MSHAPRTIRGNRSASGTPVKGAGEGSSTDREALYQARLRRYVTAMRHGKPDRVPVRPFVAEVTARHAGFTCQEVAHDYEKAFEAACRCAKDYDWDAVVANMVYVWTGLTETIGLKYYGVPGIHVPADTGFQYREPDEDHAFMHADEYDALIADPTAFLYNVWLPRVTGYIPAPGQPACYRGHLALVKGGMAMMQYFSAFGPQIERLRLECGTVSAIAGILKAPFDILADKLRGYIGLTMDMVERPNKVLRACEALMPHLAHVALTTADPARLVPVGYWMHRGCLPFVSRGQFESHYWPTVKPIVEELWRHGHQTLFYAEGDWNAHLASFAELPDASIVYHVDRADIFAVHRQIGHKFCLTGGIPNYLLSFRPPAEVRARVKDVIAGVARDGAYIVDTSAIMQNDTTIENLQAMTDAAHEFGVYSSSSPALPAAPLAAGGPSSLPSDPRARPGSCFPWDEVVKQWPPLTGDPALVRRIWEQVDQLGNMFIWQCLVSF